MHFVLELDGRKIDTGLLSGISTPSIDESMAKRYFGFDSQSTGVIREVGNGQERSSYYAMSLSAAGLNVSNARVRISDSRTARCGSTMAGDGGDSIQYAQCENTVPFTLGTGQRPSRDLTSSTSESTLAAPSTTNPGSSTDSGSRSASWESSRDAGM